MYHMMSIMVNDMLISIGLTLLAIFIISLLMTVDLTISLLSLGAVAVTIVDTAGFAHFWGLTIEPFLAVISSSSSYMSSVIIVALTSSSRIRCCCPSLPASQWTMPPMLDTASLSRFSLTNLASMTFQHRRASVGLPGSLHPWQGT